jgi:hypothetical protein
VRGFWKDQRFVPSLDAQGRPQEATLRIESTFSTHEIPLRQMPEYQLMSQKWRFGSSIEGRSPGDLAARIGRMTCRDFLWEYDFMKQQSPKKSKLEHEELFQVSFAMLIAKRNLPVESRDALLEQWSALIPQTVDSCRQQLDAKYWQDGFVPTFESAAPVGVNVQ